MENDTINIREYFPSDKEAVLELMRLNTPLYFASEEEADLSKYLDNEREYYYVLLSGMEIIGCGGINIADNGTRGRISWDIIHPDWQGHSLGSLLLKYRIHSNQQLTADWNTLFSTTDSNYSYIRGTVYTSFDNLDFDRLKADNKSKTIPYNTEWPADDYAGSPGWYVRFRSNVTFYQPGTYEFVVKVPYTVAK